MVGQSIDLSQLSPQSSHRVIRQESINKNFESVMNSRYLPAGKQGRLDGSTEDKSILPDIVKLGLSDLKSL